jgi:regulatory protein
MMAGRVTDIKAQKRSTQRVNVYLDGEYAFSVNLLTAASLGQGDVLSDEEIVDLMRRDSVNAAHDRALNFLSYRPRSTLEVRRYLTDKGFSPDVAEEAVDRLSGASLLDDPGFARYWVENRETFRPRAALLLRQELRQKGIAEAVIDDALEGTDDERSAYEAGVRQATRYDHLDDEAFKEKMHGFLRRRGFDYEVIRETVSRLLLQRGGDGSPNGDSSWLE